MQVISVPDDVRTHIRQKRKTGEIIGVVPTMGALHDGHLSLIEQARQTCSFVIVTIFVNPTQFGPGEDFDQYPRTLQADFEKCKSAGADLVFTPATEQMYPAGAQTSVHVSELTTVLEGSHRPGHFDGVCTIVAKLFNVTIPDFAFFGQKDFQQQLIIRRMAEDLNWGLQIVCCPIVRESDGLAMSSRNRYLSNTERQQALILNQSLLEAERMSGDPSNSPSCIENHIRQMISGADGVTLDYAAVVDCDTLATVDHTADRAVALVAARVGQTRLIDNRILQFR